MSVATRWPPRGYRHDEEARHEDHLQPDPQIFETVEFSFDTLAQRLRELAFLNGGITITHRRRARTQEPQVPVPKAASTPSSVPESEQGRVNDKPIYMHGDKDGIDVEIALQWNDGYSRRVLVRQQHQHPRGGTHLSGFRSA